MYEYVLDKTDEYIFLLQDYLIKHNKDFPIPLSNKVNIDKYLVKIAKLGNSIICLDEEKIIGLIFYYDNDIKTHRGFISLVSVDETHRRKGIASTLVKLVLKEMRKNNIQWCEIPTHITNQSAIKLYKSLGFKQEKKEIKENGNILLVRKI